MSQSSRADSPVGVWMLMLLSHDSLGIAPATPLAREKRRLGGAAVVGGGASRAVVEIPSTEKKGSESEPMLVSPAPNGEETRGERESSDGES